MTLASFRASGALRGARLLAAALAIPAVLLWASPSALAVESAVGRKDPARAITSQLICPCSCGEILSGCTCETAKAMQGYVSNELTKGKGKDEITAALVAKYGEVILGAPKAQGFNLVVWVAPFVVTVIGFIIAALVLTRWVKRRSPVGAGALAGAGGAAVRADTSLDDLRARAEAELRKLRE